MLLKCNELDFQFSLNELYKQLKELEADYKKLSVKERINDSIGVGLHDKIIGIKAKIKELEIGIEIKDQKRNVGYYANRGKRWTIMDDFQLLTMVLASESLEAISEALKRPQKAIAAHLHDSQYRCGIYEKIVLKYLEAIDPKIYNFSQANSFKNKAIKNKILYGK